MTYLVEGAWARRISWMLVTTLLLPMLVLAATPRQAAAQLNRIPQVAVLEFGNRPNAQGGGILGRQATDAVVVEMTRTGRFDPTPRTQLNQQLQELGLNPPLDNIGIRRLGQALGVDYVATGDITAISFSERPRRARVTLSVRLTDVISGELANGAIQSGISPEPPAGAQPDDDTLINQALSNAAFNAVQTLNNYTLPEATILHNTGENNVLLNRGSRDGITPGLEMIVIRGGDRVGRVRVATVGSTDSVATVVDPGKGIRPEDRARAVFSLPGYEVNTNTGTIKTYPVTEQDYNPRRGRKQKSILGTVLGIAAAVLLAALLFRPKSSTNNVGLRGVTARAFAEPSELAGATAPRVEVSWELGNDIPPGNVVEFQVYRGSVGPIGGTGEGFAGDVPIIALGPQQRVFFDAPTPVVPLQEFEYRQVNPTDPSELTVATTNRTGFTPGTPQTYRVEVIYRRLTVGTGGGNDGGGGGQGGGGGGQGGGGGGQGGGGGGQGGGGFGGGGGGGRQQDDNVEFVQAPISAFSSIATPVLRPEAIGPTGDVNLRAVTFTYQTSFGADEYVIEVADNPTFQNKKTLGPFFKSKTTVTQTTDGPFDLTRAPFNFREQQGVRIYYRIGARNTADNPGPVEARRLGVPNGDRYIYQGLDTSFTAIGQPPPPPGGGAGTTNPPPPPGT